MVIYGLLIILVILLVIAFIRIDIKITKDKQTNVDVLITRLFKWRIDVDELYHKKIVDNDLSDIISDLKLGLKLLSINKKVLNETKHYLAIENIDVHININVEDPVINTYLSFLNYQIINLLSCYLHNNFKRIGKEKYDVVVNYHNSFKLEFNLHLRIYLYQLVFLIMRNFKTMIKTIKIQKGAKYERKPN